MVLSWFIAWHRLRKPIVRIAVLIWIKPSVFDKPALAPGAICRTVRLSH